MEVEQVLPITSKVEDGITDGDNVIIPSSVSMEEKEDINGAAETDDAEMIITTVMDKTDGDNNTMMMRVEPGGIAISRSASSNGSRQQAKKRGAFGLFRAMFMSFSGSANMKKRDADHEKKTVDMAAAGDKLAPTAVVARSSSDVASWKNLVDGMRPLRLHGQLEYYPPPPPLGHDVYHDVLLPPPSPERPEGMTSRYSSAQDLQVLVNGHEKEEEEGTPTTEDGGCSLNAIDMQAEEFIAKFYEQFRLQKSESFNNRAD
ncbi:hypothetical protein E2562_015231 [Oryza meyeriana var. granulata]|uniref:Uncharacterized protein n=1 Tax=Oryza meyeriana var. granulata TaxID=110450 RepID=A0A6G1EWV0_9ORYZ|nr:hypothetical protein E2562_015231 [Oryza meyeriana var. granulata]